MKISLFSLYPNFLFYTKNVNLLFSYFHLLEVLVFCLLCIMDFLFLIIITITVIVLLMVYVGLDFASA